MKAIIGKISEQIGHEENTSILQNEGRKTFEYRNYIADIKTELDSIRTLADNFNELSNSNANLRNHLNSSLIISLFSFLENTLEKLCDIDYKKGFSPIEVKHLKGNNYIERSKTYFKIIAGINFDNAQNELRGITELQKIRNAIVHHKSNIIKDKDRDIEKQDLYSIIYNNEHIELDANGYFYIRDINLIYHFLDIVGRYIEYVFSLICRPRIIAKNSTMPYDNTSWGVEKMECIIENYLDALSYIDKTIQDPDIRENLIGGFHTGLWNATKVYAFFTNGEWSIEDAKIIIECRYEGYREIMLRYKGAITRIHKEE